MLMSVAVAAEAAKTAGKESLAMDAFARALSQLPTIVADNAGLDSAELVCQLRAAHTKAAAAGGGKGGGNAQYSFGIDMNKGEVTDMTTLGVLESFNVKMCMVSSAAEAAEQILRVDDIIKAAPRPRAPDRRPC